MIECIRTSLDFIEEDQCLGGQQGAFDKGRQTDMKFFFILQILKECLRLRCLDEIDFNEVIKMLLGEGTDDGSLADLTCSIN